MIGNRPLGDYFFRPTEGLYDFDKDPSEVKNIAKDPDHAQALEQLRSKLEVWQHRLGGPWLYCDGVSILFVRHHLRVDTTLEAC